MTKGTITEETSSRELQALRQRIAELEALKLEHQAEKKLVQLEGEERYKAIFESANDVILLIDKKGKIIDINEKLTEIGGYEKEEFIGKNIRSLVRIMTRKSMAIIISNFLKRLAGVHVPPYEVEMLKKNGELVTLEINARPLRKDGKIIGDLAILRDVTERKRAEEILHQSEERLRTMMEASTEGFALHNGEKVFDINKNGARMFGCERSEMIGKNAPDFVALESLDLVMKNIATGYKQPYEALLKKKDGSIFPVEIKARKITYQGKDVKLVSFRDLTLQKQYNNLLENLSIHAPISMYIVQNGRFKFVNERFCRDTGHTEQELLAMDIMQGIHPDDRMRARNYTIRMLKGERTEPYEFRTINNSGEVRWILQSVAPIAYNNQRAYIATYLDITEQRKTAAALIKSEQNLKQAQTLGRIGNWEFDLAIQKIEWSDEVYRLYERDKAVGPPSPEEEAGYYPPAQSRRLREYARLAIEKGEEFSYDLTVNLPSGKTAFFNTSMCPIKDDKGQVIKLFGTVQDITERKQAEEKYSTIIGTAIDGFWITNMEGKFIDINDSYCQMIGYSREELLTMSISDIEAVEKPEETVGRINKIKEQGFDRFETKHHRKDGRVINVEINVKYHDAEKGQMFVFVRDITDRKQAEENLQRLTNRLRELLVAIPDIIMEVNKNKVYTWGNQAAIDFFGDDVIGKEAAFYFEGEQNTYDVVKPLFNGNESTLYVESWQRRKDGQKRLLAWQCRVLKDSHGNVRGALSSAQDITERRQAEEAIRDNEENLKTYLENAPDGIYLSDLKGVFLYGNKKAEKILGYKKEELIGSNFLKLNLLPAKYLIKAGELITLNAIGRNTGPDEFELIRKDKNHIWVEINTAPTKNNGKTVIIGFVRDITERKRTEEALKTSEENFRNSLDNSALGIRIIDEDGNTLYTNHTFLDIVGYETIDEYNATPIEKRYTPEEYARYLQRVKGQKHGQLEEDNFEINIVRKDGSTRWLQLFRKDIFWNGKKQFQLIYEDITERKQAEQLYHTLTDNSPVSVYIIQDDKFVFINQTLQQHTGYTQNELLNVSATSIIHPEDRQNAEANMVQMLKGERLQPHEYRFMTKSGEIKWVLTKISSITYQGKRAMIGITIDITERKRTEEALKASEEKYRNSLDSSPLGIRIADTDGHTLYTNQAFLDIYGYKDIDEYRTIPPQKRYTPEGYADYLLQIEKRKRNEKIENNLEVNIMRKDGSSGWLQVSSKEMFWDGKKQFQSIYEDITERKQAEQLYQTLADSSTVGVYIVQNKKFVFTNPAYQKVTGFTSEELLTTNPTNLVHPEDWENVRQSAVQMLKGERLQPYEFRLITKSGEIRWGLERLTPITYQGKPANLGNFMDITERKLAEQALRRSKDSLDEAQKLAHIGSFEINTKTGKNEWSEELFRIFGINPAKTMPTIKSFLSSVHPDDRKRVAESMELSASQNQVPSIEYRVVKPDGQERNILSQIRTTLDDKGQPLTAFGTSMDITERKQAQDEISRSYHIQSAINVLLKISLEDLSLEETLQRSIDLVLSIPWLTFESRGNIFLVEDDPKVLVMKAQNGLAQPIQRACARIPFGRCLCGQAALTKETQFVDCLNERHETSYDGIIPHGHYCVPILSANNVLGVINVYVKEGHIRNKREEEFLNAAADALAGVIERKRAQEKIEHAAAEWRTTFDSITDFISILDKDNRILRVNKAVADMLKTTPKELIGKFCHEVMQGTKEPPANCPHLQTIKTGKPATMDYYNSNLGIHFNEATSPIFNEHGKVTGSVVVSRDITKQKRMEEQLIVTDRLASIGELASGIAHELNNPLTSVIGFSQLLMEGDIPPNMKEDLGTVYSEAQRAAVIVKNLLTFARKHAPVKQLSQINTIIEDVLRLRAYEQKVNNIELEKQMATNLPEIMADHFQLQQVFLNIIVNAEFAMQEAHGKGKLVITTERSNDVVKVAISDDGPGISEENLKRIFDPFFTTKEVGKGTGLGLSICHGIITEHGGKIYATSEKGKGATFIVELPLN